MHAYNIFLFGPIKSNLNDPKDMDIFAELNKMVFGRIPKPRSIPTVFDGYETLFRDRKLNALSEKM